MDRYDWEWNRGYPGPGRWSYDRNFGYGGDRWGGGHRHDPHDRSWGWGRYGGGFHGYDRWGDMPERDPTGRYTFSYPGPWSGGRGRGGRQEPWEPGPPGGYGSQWGTVYGNRPPYDWDARWAGGYEPFPRGGGAHGGAGAGYAPGPPRGGYSEPSADFTEEFDDDDFFDEEDDFDLDDTWGDEPDDGEVRNRVSRSLRQDGFIDADAIQVEVKDRVVTLRGDVRDYMEARYAWDDAWDVPGVRGVISKLNVHAADRQESPPDAARKASAGENAKGSQGGSRKR